MQKASAVLFFFILNESTRRVVERKEKKLERKRKGFLAVEGARRRFAVVALSQKEKSVPR